MTAGHLTVGQWLSTVGAATGAAAVSEEALEDLRADLVEGIRSAVSELTAQVIVAPVELPVRMPKTRMLDLLTCERHAVAKARHPEDLELSAPMLKGMAADRYIAHQLLHGRVLEPVEDLRAVLVAEVDDRAVDLLDSLGADAEVQLGPVAAAVARDWHDIDDRWLPRVQSGATLAVDTESGRAGGVTRGVVDVELGGGFTGLPTVLVEVKSAAPRSEHAAEIYFYALLTALRDGIAPAAVARWYPGTSIAASGVGPGMLESAAASLLGAYRRWCEIGLGRPPSERGGPQCRWCPEADVCPSVVLEDG